MKLNTYTSHDALHKDACHTAQFLQWAIYNTSDDIQKYKSNCALHNIYFASSPYSIYFYKHIHFQMLMKLNTYTSHGAIHKDARHTAHFQYTYINIYLFQMLMNLKTYTSHGCTPHCAFSSMNNILCIRRCTWQVLCVQYKNI